MGVSRHRLAVYMNTARLLESVDRGDVRMIQGRECFLFTLKPVQAVSEANASGRILIATTCPMPPSPIGAVMS